MGVGGGLDLDLVSVCGGRAGWVGAVGCRVSSQSFGAAGLGPLTGRIRGREWGWGQERDGQRIKFVSFFFLRDT